MSIEVIYSLLESSDILERLSGILKQKTWVSFNKIESFPDQRGVYIICEKDINEITYVGAAYKQGRSIKKRCNQNIIKNTGDTYRRKLMKRKNIMKIDDATREIKKNSLACFIEYDKSATIKEIKRMEHLLIGLLNPIDND